MLLLNLLLGACGSLWNRANVAPLEADLSSLFMRADTQPDFQICRMVGTTRTGFCRFKDDGSQIEIVIDHFNMVPIQLEHSTVAFIDAELEAGCGSFSWILEGSGGILYLVSGRPSSLRLSDTAAFEYLLLVYEASSGEACIQVSYAYG
jgi:hypothetical protein